MSDDLVLVYIAAGQVEANFIKSLLEANDIPVLSVQEGMGGVYGMTVGPLGEVKLFVTAAQRVAAEEIIRDYERPETNND